MWKSDTPSSDTRDTISLALCTDHPASTSVASDCRAFTFHRAAVGGLVLLCLLQLILIITLRSASSTRPTNTLSNLEQVLEHGWSYFNYSLYQLSNKTLPWSEAREQCRSKRAELVIINTKEEQDFIQSITRNQYIWVGLTSDWKWVDGTPETGTIWDGRSLKSESTYQQEKSDTSPIYLFSVENNTHTHPQALICRVDH
uniref:C-type lectin domain-containing protein n=1 Tax=Astyanax mexicanus TaxID=7994 RepID=A0A3B1ISL0_ASTMX